METFEASNGVVIAPKHGAANEVGLNGGPAVRNICIWAGELDALREFFLHERDQELGRWRDPDSPYLVVYPVDSSDAVRVVDEQTGLGWEVCPETKAYPTSTLYDVVKAGHHYFAAHPKQKPWHDAKPGELWEVSVSPASGENIPPREPLPMQVMLDDSDTVESRFFVHWNGPDVATIDVEDQHVEAARRIWPEVVSDGA